MPCTEPGAKDAVMNHIDMIPIMKTLNFTEGTDKSIITGTNVTNIVGEENKTAVPTLILEEGFLKSKLRPKNVWRLAKFLKGEHKREKTLQQRRAICAMTQKGEKE